MLLPRPCIRPGPKSGRYEITPRFLHPFRKPRHIGHVLPKPLAPLRLALPLASPEIGLAGDLAGSEVKPGLNHAAHGLMPALALLWAFLSQSTPLLTLPSPGS